MTIGKPGKSVVTSAIASIGVLGATVSLPLGTAQIAAAHDHQGNEWQNHNVTSTKSDPQWQQHWTAPSVPEPAKTAEAAPSFYTVVKGDTLSNIAYEKHVAGGWPALYEANKPVIGDNPNLIYPGQHLKLNAPQVHTPVGTTTPPAPKPTPTPSTTAVSSIPMSAGCGNMAAWTAAAHQIISFPTSWDAGLKRLASDESSCNPKAINNWDANAKAGTPSKGLMQVIDPTFQAYKISGHNDIWNPVDNLAAAVNYIKHRYGYVPSSPY